MTREDLNQMCREYQEQLLMSEEEVMDEYNMTKAELLAASEEEIDFWERYFGYRY